MMLHVPFVTAVTKPAASTVAIAVLSLLHAPVPVPSTRPVVVYVAVPPIHNGLVPLTEVIDEFGLTVIAPVALTVPQPPVNRML